MAVIATHSSKHNILNVLPEVTERIAKVAEPKDLLNLRLVCKEADARIFRVYGRVYFAHWQLLLHSEERLAVVLEVAQSEN